MMFDYFNNFYQWIEDNPDKVDPYITAVYFALLNRANKSGWKDKFAIILIDLQETCGINSRTTMLKTLSKLEEFGFLQTVSTTQNQYKNRIISLPLNGNHLDSTWKPLEKHVDITWTHNKTIKIDKTIKTIKTKGADLNKVYSENENVNKVFIEFLQNRIEIKKPATQRAADLLVSEMRKLYKSPDEAIKGINQSIMKGWTGLFPLGSQLNKPAAPQQTQFNRSSANHYK
jgi:hypothetical protein